MKPSPLIRPCRLLAAAVLLACQLLHAAEPPVKAPAVDRTAHQIALNQIGFQTAGSKRFTAPLSADGTPFIIRLADGKEILHRSTITAGIGDFSAFQPADSAGNYVIEIRGGELKPGLSDPFLIRRNIWQENYWQPAVDFLIDSRSVIGTHPSAFGGCPWRDGNYYDAIIPSLILFHLADPAKIAAMPKQIDWQAEKQRVLDPAFKFNTSTPESGGVLEAARSYFTELEPPSSDAPDVVKLIHWGAGFYLIKPTTKDPMGGPAASPNPFADSRADFLRRLGLARAEAVAATIVL